MECFMFAAFVQKIYRMERISPAENAKVEGDFAYSNKTTGCLVDLSRDRDNSIEWSPLTSYESFTRSTVSVGVTAHES